MKQQRLDKALVYSMLALMLAIVFVQTAFANSAEPPGLTVIVSFPPESLTLSIRFADGSVANAVQLEREQKAWEAYYRFFYWMVAPTRPSLEGATLVVQSADKNFECVLPESTFNQYNSLITLNFAEESIIVGQLPYRSFLLVAMRVTLTLLIEGLICFAFGYRKKVSWIAFVVINLITQGMLNNALSGLHIGPYWIFPFVFFEIIIFIVEMIAFAIVLREHSKGRAVAYALTANLASLILGGMLISYLPV